jgi:hypothetical protein
MDELIVSCPRCQVMRKLPPDWRNLIEAKANAIGADWDGIILCDNAHRAREMLVASNDVILFKDEALLLHLLDGTAYCVVHPWDLGEAPEGSVFCLCEACALVQRYGSRVT